MKNIIDLCNINISNSLCSLYEASLLDIDGTLDYGDTEVERQMIKKWVEENKNFLNTGFCGEKFIKSDNTLDLASFSPYDHYNNKYMELPVPKYIKISDVEDLLIHAVIEFDKLPEMDYVNMLYIDTFSDTYNGDVKLTNIPIKSLKNIFIRPENATINGFPKIAVENVIYSSSTLANWQYDGRMLVNDPKKFLKGLNTKYLVIPDAFFTTDYEKMYSYRPNASWSADRLIEAGTDEAKLLQKFFDTGAFKELYTYSGRDFSASMEYRKVTKTKDGFTISKRKKHFKF